MSQDAQKTSADADICHGIDRDTYILAGEMPNGIVVTLVHWHAKPPASEVAKMIHSIVGDYRRFMLMQPVSFHNRPTEPSQARH